MSALRHGRRALTRLAGRHCAAPSTLEPAAQQSVQQAPQRAALAVAWQQARRFRAGRPELGQVPVEVQSMGESISEGSIAELLKREGDAVAEDETIAQIETDKVTIDVRAPVAGRLAELKVAVEDTVRVGQVVAVISEGEEGASSSGSGAEAKPDQSGATEAGTSPQEDQQQEQQEQASAEVPHRTPAIRFPPRVTPDGRRISDLPAEERRKYQQEGGAHAPAAQSAPEQQQQQPPQQQQASAPSQSEPRKSVPWYVGQEQGTKLSQSRVLSQREMEQIELGGADP